MSKITNDRLNPV